MYTGIMHMCVHMHIYIICVCLVLQRHFPFISHHGIWIKFKRINETKQIARKMDTIFFTHEVL